MSLVILAASELSLVRETLSVIPALFSPSVDNCRSFLNDVVEVATFPGECIDLIDSFARAIDEPASSLSASCASILAFHRTLAVPQVRLDFLLGNAMKPALSVWPDFFNRALAERDWLFWRAVLDGSLSVHANFRHFLALDKLRFLLPLVQGVCDQLRRQVALLGVPSVPASAASVAALCTSPRRLTLDALWKTLDGEDLLALVSSDPSGMSVQRRLLQGWLSAGELAQVELCKELLDQIGSSIYKSKKTQVLSLVGSSRFSESCMQTVVSFTNQLLQLEISPNQMTEDVFQRALAVAEELEGRVTEHLSQPLVQKNVASLIWGASGAASPRTAGTTSPIVEFLDRSGFRVWQDLEPRRGVSAQEFKRHFDRSVKLAIIGSYEEELRRSVEEVCTQFSLEQGAAISKRISEEDLNGLIFGLTQGRLQLLQLLFTIVKSEDWKQLALLTKAMVGRFQKIVVLNSTFPTSANTATASTPGTLPGFLRPDYQGPFQRVSQRP